MNATIEQRIFDNTTNEFFYKVCDPRVSTEPNSNHIWKYECYQKLFYISRDEKPLRAQFKTDSKSRMAVVMIGHREEELRAAAGMMTPNITIAHEALVIVQNPFMMFCVDLYDAEVMQVTRKNIDGSEM